MLDGVEIDLGLAGSGDPLEEEGFEDAGVEGGPDLIEGGLLMRVEVVRGALGRGERERRLADAEELAAGEGASGLAGAGVRWIDSVI